MTVVPCATRKFPVRALFLLGVSFTSLANVIAQVVVAPTAALPFGAPRPEEAVVLSPFEVSTSKDVSFVAASPLAGGRLAGDLKDTPVAYSALTRELIDTLNPTDLISASKWTVNSTSLVGAHWFFWRDLDSPTRQANRGLFRADGRPWIELTQALAELNRRLPQL